jgi:glycosyltransferase involved in cell wall biosynthesis
VRALARALDRLLSDPELRARMSRAARLQGETQSQVRAADGFLAAVAYAMQSKRARPGAHAAGR